ncbi:hypothetical protein CASFOL_020515 [Castilleja foliolosa]|uniref:SET domain-containing protein n=1 Tax=Castilleja foliolosa TaxID=1961234 RepID=A0ABD3D129_9LAMI
MTNIKSNAQEVRGLSQQRTVKCSDSSLADTNKFDTMSSARCRIYKRPDIKRTGYESISHRLIGPHHHTLDVISSLSSNRKNIEEIKAFPTFREQLERSKKNLRFPLVNREYMGGGLFARRSIQEGEMVVEYHGEQVRLSIADLSFSR